MRSGVVKAAADGESVHHDLKHANAVVRFVLDLKNVLEEQMGCDVTGSAGGRLFGRSCVADGIQASLQILASHEGRDASDEVNLESNPVNGGELENVGVGLFGFHNEENLAHCVTDDKRKVAHCVKYFQRGFSPLNVKAHTPGAQEGRLE